MRTPPKRSVKKNEYGFYQLDPIPTEQELNAYYAEKYYQNNNGQYCAHYDENEIKFIETALRQKELLIQRFASPGITANRMLDVGCGEGFALAYFHKHGYDVLGIDYSSYGLNIHNPEMEPYFIQGELLSSCQKLLGQNERFHVIHLDNVLEHVINPGQVLGVCAGLLAPKGIIVIEVPNDFNRIQEFLLQHEMIHAEKWVCVPDHISYFNREGLRRLCESVGLKEYVVLGDQLIELFAFNPDSNYMDDPAKGHNCHLARIAIEQLFEEISTDKTVDLKIALGNMGLGRQIIGFYYKNS